MYRRVSTVVCGEEEVELALDMLRERIKEELWREVWKDMVDVAGVDEEVMPCGDGRIKVTVIYDDTEGLEPKGTGGSFRGAQESAD